MFFRGTDFFEFLFSFFKHLFSRSASAAPPPVSWHTLERTAAHTRRHERWRQEQVYRNWAAPYFKAYHFKKANVTGQGLRVQLLQECGRRGVLLFYDPSIGPGNFRHFFDFIAEQTQRLGYNLSTSDQRTLKHPRYQETIYKHFLKPKPECCPDTGRCQQQFGNVTVDLIYINKQPGFIRFFSNPFDDPIFAPAQPFEELLRQVMDLPAPDAATQKLIKTYYQQ